MKSSKNTLSLKNLTKSNVWDLQENDLIRIIQAGEKDIDTKDNLNHYIDIAKSAFDFEEMNPVVLSTKSGRLKGRPL